MSCVHPISQIRPPFGGRRFRGEHLAMKKLPHIASVLFLTAAAALSAQSPTTSDTPDRGSRRGPGGPGRGGHPIVRALDADKNGELSSAEIANAPAALRALDINADGNLTRDELRPARPAQPANAGTDRPAKTRTSDSARPADAGERVRAADPVMLALDADHDGALGAAEIGNATASLNALDANKDGKLTRDELRPLPTN